MLKLGTHIRVIANQKRYKVVEVFPLLQAKDGKSVPMTLHDYLPESDKTTPIVWYVAKSFIGREIYIGDETREEIRELFGTAKIILNDIDRFYNISEIEILEDK